MLVLSRKCDESVVLGGSSGSAHLARITVLEISGGSVRLGFEADKEIPVYREEVWERIRNSRLRDPPTGKLDRERSDNTNGKTGVLSGGGKGTYGQVGIDTRMGSDPPDRSKERPELQTKELDRWEDEGGGAI